MEKAGILDPQRMRPKLQPRPNSELSMQAEMAVAAGRDALAAAELEIDLASIDAGSKDANDELAGKACFNTKVFPVAKFVLTSVKPLGDNRFEVAGKMTIKGRTCLLYTSRCV